MFLKTWYMCVWKNVEKKHKNVEKKIIQEKITEFEKKAFLG